MRPRFTPNGQTNNLYVHTFVFMELVNLVYLSFSMAALYLSLCLKCVSRNLQIKWYPKTKSISVTNPIKIKPSNVSQTPQNIALMLSDDIFLANQSNFIASFLFQVKHINLGRIYVSPLLCKSQTKKQKLLHQKPPRIKNTPSEKYTHLFNHRQEPQKWKKCAAPKRNIKLELYFSSSSPHSHCVCGLNIVGYACGLFKGTAWTLCGNVSSLMRRIISVYRQCSRRPHGWVPNTHAMGDGGGNMYVYVCRNFSLLAQLWLQSVETNKKSIRRPYTMVKTNYLPISLAPFSAVSFRVMPNIKWKNTIPSPLWLTPFFKIDIALTRIMWMALLHDRASIFWRFTTSRSCQSSPLAFAQ